MSFKQPVAAKLPLAFLGTNGWYATRETGNTVSALVETADRYIVLDAGDGIHHLDEHVRDANKPIDLFLSHFHLDHVIGLHIQPKFRHAAPIRIFVMKGGKETLERLIDHPYSAPFALLAKLNLHVTVHELELGPNHIHPPGAERTSPAQPSPGSYLVTTGALAHADPCWGFRFELPRNNGGKAVLAYCTDTGPCDNLAILARGADVLITECGLLPGESSSPAWPHLSPDMAAQAAKDAGARQLFLTHFPPNKYPTLEKRKAAGSAARKIFPATQTAYDGMQVHF